MGSEYSKNEWSINMPNANNMLNTSVRLISLLIAIHLSAVIMVTGSGEHFGEVTSKRCSKLKETEVLS